MQVTGVAGAGQLVISSQPGQQVSIPLDQLKANEETVVDLSGLELGDTLSIRVKRATAGGVGYVVYKQITLVPR